MPAITNLTGTGYLFPLQSGNSGKYLTTDGNVLSWGTPSGGGGLSGSGTTNYISKWTSGSALGNSLIYDDGTSILVNTTSTQGQKFQVNGDALVSGLLTISGATVLPAQTASHLRFGSGYASPDIGRMYIGDGTGWKFHMAKRISSTTTDLVTFQDNGNVGIGIATPGHLLEVNGDAMVSGTTELMTYTGVGINADSSTMLYVQGSGNTAEDFSAVFQNSDFDNLMKIHNNGKINMGFLPTSATGLSTGDLWNDSGTLKIV